MAKPRVFVASTFYDLQIVRADLHTFIRELGYEPVLFEKSGVAYSGEKKLEDSCYAEIQRCDILVALVGDRYGTDSKSFAGSISQNEVRQAIKDGKQVHVFIQDNVSHEYQLWKRNRENESVKYAADPRVFPVVDEIENIPTVALTSFRTSRDITDALRDQWAGLFQDLLGQRRQVQQQAALNHIHEAAEKLEKLVERLGEERTAAFAINHPGIRKIGTDLGHVHRAFVLNRTEFDDWVRTLGFRLYDDDQFEGTCTYTSDAHRLTIKPNLMFGQSGTGQLRQPPVPWTNDIVQVECIPAQQGDDEFPF